MKILIPLAALGGSLALLLADMAGRSLSYL
jgi:ABC-type Fe3+-siderophore transport system permease subunit